MEKKEKPTKKYLVKEIKKKSIFVNNKKIVKKDVDN